MTWQPIETAPKDKIIDLWADKCRWANMLWSEPHKQWSRYESRGQHMITIIYISLGPTHWQDLPEPPK